jgi:2-phosphosulfolactate phosphatase
MLSSSGTALLAELANATTPAFVACFRNSAATAAALGEISAPIALIGAGSRGNFREEDQMGCAWVARSLVSEGFSPSDPITSEVIERWANEPAAAASVSDSVGYLRSSGQLRDFSFILDHVDDLDLVCRLDGREVRPGVPGMPARTPLARD